MHIRTAFEHLTNHFWVPSVWVDLAFHADLIDDGVARGDGVSSISPTFTARGTEATYFSGGVLETATTDTARHDGTLGLLLEPEGANILLGGRGTDMATSAWLKGANITVTADQTGVDGVANKAATIEETSSSTNHWMWHEIDIAPNSGPYTFQVCIKKDSGVVPGIYFIFSGGTNKYAAYQVNTETGELSLVSDSASGVSAGSEEVGDFWRVWMTATDNGSNDTLGIRIYPAVAETFGGSPSNTPTGSIVCDFAQLEYAAFPSSLIDTEGVSLATMEDVSGWEAETDGANRLTTYGTSLFRVVDLDRDEDMYRYHDGGAADSYKPADGFTHQFWFNVDDTETGAGMAAWALTDANDDLYDIQGNSGDALFFWLGGNGKLEVYEVNGGSISGSGSPLDYSTNTDYYVTIDVQTSVGTYGTLRARVWTTSDRETTLVGTITKALGKDYSLRYVGISTYNDASSTGVAAGAWIGNYTLTEGFPQIAADPSLSSGGGFLTAGNNWAYDGTNDEYDHTAGGGTSDLTDADILSSGKVYQIKFVIGNSSAGSITPKAGGTSGDVEDGGDGTYYQYIISGGTDLVFTASADFDGSLQSYEVKEFGNVRQSEENSFKYSLSNELEDLFSETLGSEINSGSLTEGTLYKITADTGGDFYTGSSTGEYFIATGTETCDADSKVKEVTNARSDGTHPCTQTVLTLIRTGFSESLVDRDWGVVSVRPSSASLLWFDNSANGWASVDTAVISDVSHSFSDLTWYWLVVQIGIDLDGSSPNTLQFRVGHRTMSGDMTWGSVESFSGTFTIAGTDLVIGYTLFGPLWIKGLKIYKGVLEDTTIKNVSYT